MGIYKRKDSQVYWLRKTVNGRQYRQSTDTTSKMRAQAQYERWVAELREKVEKGEPVETAKERREPVSEMQFFELCDRYLGWCNGRQKGFNVKKYIIPQIRAFFGDRPLSEFTFALVESYQDKLLKEKYAVSYVNKHITIIKHFFHKALDWELIDEAAYKKILKVKQLKGETKRLRYLTPEEEARLLECCEPSYLRPIVITALNTGMRRNEILGLTWDGVDIKNHLILLAKTKNYERREIPISDDLYAVLSGMVRNLKVKYIFYNPKTLTRWERLKGSWERAVKRAKLQDFHFHDLRHTFASKLVMAGVPLLTVSKLLGHKDIKMTLRYAHLAPSAFRDAINVLNEKRARKEHGQDETESIETRNY